MLDCKHIQIYANSNHQYYLLLPVFLFFCSHCYVHRLALKYFLLFNIVYFLQCPCPIIQVCVNFSRCLSLTRTQAVNSVRRDRKRPRARCEIAEASTAYLMSSFSSRDKCLMAAARQVAPAGSIKFPLHKDCRHKSKPEIIEGRTLLRIIISSFPPVSSLPIQVVL